jgi:uncharacterized repeat protein (TIGR01451 family)/fimbrial isopeptide formation D2 family protein
MKFVSVSMHRLWRMFLALVLVGGVLFVVAGEQVAEAAGTPNIALTKNMPSEALAGDPAIPVTLSAANPTGTDGFNLTFTDVLPAGVSLVSSSPAPTQTLANTPGPGETTLVWRNVTDLQAGVTEAISYTITHDGTLNVGDSFTNRASAYVNSDPRIVPSYNTVTDTVDNATGFDTDVSATTNLVPFLLTKVEPNTEAELLRGLHDQQTVYTFEIQNNYLNNSNTFAIEDWIPAGMEFLACGLDDNSTTTGNDLAGPINPGNAPGLTNPCVNPDTVETVVVDPPGPLPLGTYTHVVWSSATLATALTPGSTARFDYVAAIPMRENTTTWDGVGGEPATTGPQGSNIDNNNGSLTEETLTEQAMTNYAELTGIYTGDGGTYTDSAEFTVSAEDVSIHKSVDQGAITQGADSVWTLLIETSEYTTTAASIVVTDTLPDGLCPLGAGSPDVECQAAGSPSQPYTSATENSDGTWTIIWNVADIGQNGSTTITFPTKTRAFYQEAFADADPVLAKDSWVNNVDLTATADGRPVEDVSSAGQEAGGVTILKQVATRPATGVCGDGSGLTWNSPPTEPVYNVGDRVCWSLTVNYPPGLDTFDSDIQDFIPPGHSFTGSDGWQLGAASTAPAPNVTFDGSAAASGVLNWTVGDGGLFVDESVTVEIIVSTTVTDPNATASGEIVENLMKFSYANTAGTPFNLRSLANVQVIEPELDLVKGVYEVVRGVTSVEGPNVGNPNVDGVLIMPGDVVTYQITVTNSGDLAADNVEVWDNLPAEWATCSTQVTNITNGGVCDDANNRVVWDAANVFSVSAGGSQVLRYDVTVPSGIAPRETMINSAGVRTYTGVTNNGTGTFVFVPASNIDPAAPASNTAVADDTSNVFTGTPTLGKTAVTAITEAGNTGPSEATIGEEITYTATVVIPEGTSVYGPAVFTDSLAPELELVSASFTFDGVPLLDPAYPTINVDTATDIVTVTFANPYDNPVGTDDSLIVTIVARVGDVGSNTRGTSVQNSASFAWDNQDAVAQTPITASVATGVVEPNISLTKNDDDADGIVVGNDVVNYTLGISNGSAGTVSVAHDVVVVDTLPEGVTPTLPIADGGVWAPDGVSGNGVLGTITWVITSIDPSTTVNRTYQVTIDDPVIVSSSFTNNAVVDVTSLAGTPTGERTSGTGYSASASDVLNTPLVSIAKSVTPTSATIGDIVEYTVDVTIPAATIMFDATVLDSLPAGLEFDGITGSSCASSGGGACLADITVGQIGTVGSQTAAFFLGDISTPSSNGEDRIVTITYEAHLLDSGVAGNARINSANVYGNQTDQIVGTPGTPPLPGSFDVQATPATATVFIVEPVLTVDKDVNGQVGDTDNRRAIPGDTLTYTVTVRNTGSSDANDITVTDTPDSRFIPVSITSGAGYVVDDADPTDGTLQWTVAGPIASSGSVTITYQVQVPPTFDSTDENPVGFEMTNTVDIPSYFGVPAVERAANPTFTYRDYDNVTPDTVNIELDLASIGDRVWFDANADGIQDGPEPGLVGVDVTVTYLGANGVTGGGDDEVFVTTTGANGIWGVTDLPGGNYSVSVDTADIPFAMVASYDLDDGTTSPDDQWTGALGENEDKTDVDFGYTGSGSIGDTIWFDRNGDGVLDTDEYGLEGVGVTITWFGLDGVVGGGDDITYAATTGASGGYLIPNLPQGDYTVLVNSGTLPAGMQPTFDDDGIGTPHATGLALASGEDNLVQDFGYNGTGSIGDFVWFDENGDGVQDAGESGIPGATVQLTWPGEDGVLGGGDDEVFVMDTDGTGAYLFDGLPPGDYQVDIIGGLPALAINTFDEDGGADSSAVVSLADGEVHLTTDFGYRGDASIGDKVWWDVNGDGVVDVGEPVLPGVEVTLTFGGVDGILGTADDITATTTTDSSGVYTFPSLAVGDYRVDITGGVPGGMVPTYDEDGGNDGTSLVTGLASGEIYLTADFGYNGTGSIGDVVWLDLNADGVEDAGEPGIAGVDVTLTWFGGDGGAGGGDDVVFTDTTDATGNYLFPNLPAGGYTVVVDSASLPSGANQTFDSDGIGTPDASALTLAAGEDNLVQDFGYSGGASVGDTIWWDLDGDSVQQAGEPGLAGIDVMLTFAGLDGIFGNGDDAAYATTTDSAGTYLFTELPPGSFRVVVDEGDLPPGMTQTADPDGGADGQSTLSLVFGEADLAQDFGYRGIGSIGDFVWYDVNSDDAQDADEPGAAGVDVTVTYFGPDGVLGGGDDVAIGVTTDGMGNYTVPGLPAGGYEVSLDVATLPTGLTASSDIDGGDATRSTVILGASQVRTDVDFAIVGDASLSGTVWNDVNGDGVMDPGEVGISGVSVVVTWDGPDGPVVMVMVSSGDGSWALPNLPPGDYTVELDESTVPAGMSPTTPIDAAVTLPVGGTAVVDIGLAEVVTLGSTVWIDLNGDGVPDTDEDGIPGVTVNLLDTDGALVATVVTDAGGNYLFTDLVPGTYVVSIDGNTIPEELRPTFDRDGSPDLVTTVVLVSGNSILDANFGFQVGLPFTGFNIGEFLLLALLAILLGMSLVVLSKRQRRIVPASVSVAGSPATFSLDT